MGTGCSNTCCPIVESVQLQQQGTSGFVSARKSDARAVSSNAEEISVRQQGMMFSDCLWNSGSTIR